MSEAPLLQVQNLQVHFSKGGQTIRAVDDVSFSIRRGRTLGLVGESGCGKSTTGYALLRLIEPTGGRVLLDGIDLATLNRGELRRRRRRMQLIFQDAAASLDPRMPIGDIISEALAIHGLYSGRARAARVRQLLDIVGIPTHFSERYPHQLSGGQAQRIAICRALAVEPELIVCDEPVSALDVSIQAQIINLLQDLQNELNLSYLFISHDLSVVRHISHEVAVMYLGRIAEWADRGTIFRDAAHPYTAALLSAVPIPDPELEMHRKRIVLQGDLPSPANPPPGCRFAPRCPVVLPECTVAPPEFRQLGPTHSAACIRLPASGPVT